MAWAREAMKHSREGSGGVCGDLGWKNGLKNGLALSTYCTVPLSFWSIICQYILHRQSQTLAMSDAAACSCVFAVLPRDA